MSSDLRTFRNRRTGRLGQYSRALASTQPDLIEVEEDAKPLAYTPIPSEAVDALRSDDDADAEPAPRPARARKTKGDSA